jgi:hypothetical protein
VSSATFQNRVCNGSQVDQGLAGKAQQEPEGEMEETETSGAAEAPAYPDLTAWEEIEISMMKRETFAIASIYVPVKRRATLDPKKAQEIAESIL